jgi:hypothetical protein
MAVHECNTNDTSLSNPRQAACTGIFKNFKGRMCGVAQNLGMASALRDEVNYGTHSK